MNNIILKQGIMPDVFESETFFNEILKEHATINLNETNYEKLLLITEESINKINIKTKGGMNFG